MTDFLPMKSITWLLLFLAFNLIIISCKKDSDKEDLTPKGILTSHGWKISSMIQTSGNIPGYNYEVEDCKLDDCMIFKSDGTFNTNIGSVKCDPNETGETGTWSLSEDGNNFDLNGSIYYSIKSIETTSLVLLYEYAGWGFEITYVPC